MKKTMQKGFSLVEVIIALVIAAIILAVCAPNVSAYVQSAKLQNYRTTLNNLVGDVQSQLPQTRYWNWEEVKENAESILRSDSARTVTSASTTDTTAVYDVAGASTDANVVYEITLTYDTSATSSNTSQQVTVDGACIGYGSVTSSETCEVLLKTSYTDSGLYPTYTSTITTTTSGGWSSLEDRVKSWSDWKTFFTTFGNEQYDFRTDVAYPDWWSDDYVVINLADYITNSVKFVQFEMDYYCGYYISDYSTWPNYTYSGYLAFPTVYTNDGAGTGTVYAVSQSNSLYSDNVYIYIGDDSDEESLKYIAIDSSGNEIFSGTEYEEQMAAHNWVRYDVIFSDAMGTFQTYTDSTLDGALALVAFQAKYDYAVYEDTDGSHYNNEKILYRVNLINSSGVESSRGWIAVTGNSGVGGTVYLDENDDILVYVNNGTVPTDHNSMLYNTVIENWYTYLYFDLNKCGYSVGNALMITLTDIDADTLYEKWLAYETGTSSDWTLSIVQNVSKENNDSGASISDISDYYTLVLVDSNTLQIVLDLTYNMYPYLRLTMRTEYAGLSSSDSVSVSLYLDTSGGYTYETTISYDLPMLTINGGSNYVGVTLDWSKCDSDIIEANTGLLGVKFTKNGSSYSAYTLYDTSYNEVSCTPISNFKLSYINSSYVADGVIHFYFEGISAEELLVEFDDDYEDLIDLLAPEEAVTTTTASADESTTTTTTTTMTTTSTDATDDTSTSTETTATTVTADDSNTITTTTIETTTQIGYIDDETGEWV